MAISEVIGYQQLEINIELVCVTINFGNFYSELHKEFSLLLYFKSHYC